MYVYNDVYYTCINTMMYVHVECRFWQQHPLLSIVYMLVQFLFVRIQEFQSDVQKEGEISKVAQEFSETVTDPKIQATEVCLWSYCVLFHKYISHIHVGGLGM